MQVAVSRNGRRDSNATCPRLRDETPCGYCFSRWATGYDHIIPWVYGGTEERSNLYPSCRRCNSILGSKIFASLQEKREYVRSWLIEQGEWYNYDDSVPVLPETVSTQPPSSILLPEVPMGRVDTKEGRVRVSEAWSPEASRRWSPSKTRRCFSCRIVFEFRDDWHYICQPTCERLTQTRIRMLNIRDAIAKSPSKKLVRALSDCINEWLSINTLPLTDAGAKIYSFASWPDKCDRCGLRAYRHPRFAHPARLYVVARMCSGDYYSLWS
jgi:hypothetical protein